MTLEQEISEATKKVRASHARHRSKLIEKAVKELVRLGFYSGDKLNLKNQSNGRNTKSILIKRGAESY